MSAFPTIILRDASPVHAARMLSAAQQFARDFADRSHGIRHFVGYRHLDYCYLAYWTKARAVVVRLTT